MVPVNDLPEGYDYPPEVRFEIEEQELDSYLRAADFLNFANTDIVCLQHEYGIFGGPAGSHVLRLLRDLRMPVVTTLHTVLKEPERRPAPGAEPARRPVGPGGRDDRAGPDVPPRGLRSPRAQDRPDRHGIPDMPFVDPNFYKDQFGVEGKYVALTFGLLSPNKGIEHMLRAVPAVLEEFPELRLHRAGGDPPQPDPRARRELSDQPGAAGPTTWASSRT